MPRTKSRQPLNHKIRARLLLLVAALVLLMTAWVVIGRQAMHLVPEYRHDLEQLLEARLHTPLEIGAMRGYMDGATPVFVFENVRLPAQESVAPLQIERVELTVDVLASVANRTLRARQLLVSGIDLHLSVSEQGKVQLTGLEALGSSAAAPSRKPPIDALLDLIYRQKRLVVENARGVLSLANLPDIEVADLAVAVVSSGTNHRLSLHAYTADRPVEVDVRIAINGDAHTLDALNGSAWVRVRAAEADPWINAVLADRAHIADLSGEAEFWLSVQRGKVEDAQAHLAFTDVSIDGPATLKPLVLTDVVLDASVKKTAENYVLQVSQLKARHGQQSLQIGPAAVAWNGETAEQRRWQIAARDLNLGALRSWAVGLPVKWPDNLGAVIERLTQLSPAGELEALAARGGQTLEHFSARFDVLAATAVEKIPGVSGFSGWVAGDFQHGVAMLDSEQLTLDLPLLFRWPMTVQGKGPLRWQRHDDERISLQTGWLRVSNADANGRAVAEVNLAPGEMPTLSLIAGIADGDAKQAPHYIPLKKLPNAVAEWLASAFEGGYVDRGALIYEGPVKIDPDRQQDRTLQVGIQGRNLKLHYRPDWPLVTELNADVVIDGREIRGRNVNGRIFSARLENANVDVPDYDTGETPLLIIHSRVTGPANDIQRLLQETPLREKLPAELAGWQVGAGQMRGNALLYVPLGASSESMQILVNAGLKAAEIGNAKRKLQLTGVSGAVDFTLLDGLQAKQLQAQLWGQPVQATVSSKAQKTHLQFSGQQPVSAIRQWLEAKWLDAASGMISYQADMELPGANADVELNVDADLVDVALTLPEPLARKAGTPMRGRLQLLARDGEQDLSIDVGKLLNGKLRLRDGLVERGQFVLNGGGARMPEEPGVWVTGVVPKLTVNTWVDYFSAKKGDELGDAPFPLKKVSLQVEHLDLFDLDIASALVHVVPEPSRWRYAIDSDQLAAQALVPDGYEARASVPMTITVQHLFLETNSDDLGTSDAGQAPTLLDIDPMAMPVADVQIDTVVLDNADFGQWQFGLRPRSDGTHVSAIHGVIRQARVDGSIEWTKDKTAAQSHFVGSVASSDVAGMLKQWDFPRVLESNSMRSLVDVVWAGSPLDLDPLALTGKASLEMGESRFPKTDSKTSALRVLGVLNLGTVSRRLRLDFTDLYKKGLICDSIGGDFVLDGPLLTTDNLVIKSPSAEFRVKGQVNMDTTSLNHQVEVTLPLSSNLYVGCFAGPAACAGIFVVERLWGNKLEKMTTLGYEVSGNWDDPVVKEVTGMFERKK